MSDPGMTSEQRAAVAVHYAEHNRICLDPRADGSICLACAEVADQIDAAVLVAEQAAEERGRRRGVEEAAKIIKDKVREWVNNKNDRRNSVDTVVDDACTALAPRDSMTAVEDAIEAKRKARQDEEAEAFKYAPRDSAPREVPGPFAKGEDPAKCMHAWECHVYERGKDYCPYCFSMREEVPRDSGKEGT